MAREFYAKLRQASLNQKSEDKDIQCKKIKSQFRTFYCLTKIGLRCFVIATFRQEAIAL